MLVTKQTVLPVCITYVYHLCTSCMYHPSVPHVCITSVYHKCLSPVYSTRVYHLCVSFRYWGFKRVLFDIFPYDHCIAYWLYNQITTSSLLFTHVIPMHCQYVYYRGCVYNFFAMSMSPYRNNCALSQYYMGTYSEL